MPSPLTPAAARYEQERTGYAIRLRQLEKARTQKGNGGPVVYSGFSDSHVTMAEYNWQCCVLAAWGQRGEMLRCRENLEMADVESDRAFSETVSLGLAAE